MNILVTGGTGFIGSHVSLLLIEQGHNVFILDSLINSNEIVFSRIKKLAGIKCQENILFFKGDLRKIEDIHNIFNCAKERGKPIETVLHFAGLKSASESSFRPMAYWENNVIASLNLIKVMEQNNCKKIVFSSSAIVYGDKYQSPISESNYPDPKNPYGHTKLSIENFLSNMFSDPDSDWKIAILRYFNPAGNHKSGIIGEDPKGLPTNLFPLICKVAVGNIRRIKVFGDDWETLDGSGVRDYIHVMDLAEGHIRALDFIINKRKKVFLVLNLGTGFGTSVFEMIDTFERVNDLKIDYEVVNRRICDSAQIFADCKKAKEILGWTPKRSLEDICRDGWKWQKDNPNGYNFLD